MLRFISDIPAFGEVFGFNTVGGVALVMIALDLPLGIWLMKGFFDNLSWDMERAALIDGASRFRVWWEIILPQIKPGPGRPGHIHFSDRLVSLPDSSHLYCRVRDS